MAQALCPLDRTLAYNELDQYALHAARRNEYRNRLQHRLDIVLTKERSVRALVLNKAAKRTAPVP